MKSLIKFFPVAVGVLALASCSNDDFFGSSNEDGKLELVATVVAPAGSDDGLSTRSVVAPAEAVADYKSYWQGGDVFRVYDAMLQKYDAFSYKAESAKVTIDTESPKVTEYAKAIFPGNAVSYAGWSAENDAVTATVMINPNITYSAAVKVDNKTAYASNIPMWGNATQNEDHLAVELQPLVSYTDITVYGGVTAAKYIRVISTNATNRAADIAKAWSANNSITGNPSAPLTGYFDALLKNDATDSYLVANLTAPLADKYGYYIGVDLTGVITDEAHVIIPIVAQTYENLIIQYSTDGTTWTILKEYTDQVVPNNYVLRGFDAIGTAIETQEAKVSKFSDINARLQTFTGASYTSKKILNIDLSKTTDVIKTSDGNQTITIPDYNAEKIINLNFDIDDTDYNLTIDNNNTKTTVLNLQTINGNVPVTINQGTITATGEAFVITGEINSTGNGELKRLNVGETGNLTLGLGAFGPFKSNMNMYLTANVGKLYIDAAEGNTIAAIDASADTNTSDINVESGTVTAIGGTTAAATPVTVNGGTITTLKTTAANITVAGGNVETISASGASSISVSGGTVGTATTGNAIVNITGGTVNKITNGTSNVTIGTDATVNEVTTASTGTIAVNSNVSKLTMTGVSTLTITEATVGELNANVNGATINLAGTTKLAQITELKTNKTTGAVNDVSSTGQAAILSVSADARFSFTSTWDGKKAAIGSANKIYTAAQLASATTGKAYTLLTNITAFNETWTPVNISANFTGNNKTLTGLNAPLFGTISGGTVKQLKLDDVTIASKAANQGALAQIVNGTVNIENIEVKATTASTIGAASGTADADSKNIGGLVGKASGTVALKDNKVSATVQGYANVGGYIGNFESGKVTMTVTNATNFVSTVEFAMSYQPAVAAGASNANYGTFGKFIGSITGTAEVQINKNSNTVGHVIGHYFAAGTFNTADTGTNPLKFANNKLFDENGTQTKKFAGMTNNEFGYSTGSIAEGNLVLYAEEDATDEMGNPLVSDKSINDINIWVNP